MIFPTNYKLRTRFDSFALWQYLCSRNRTISLNRSMFKSYYITIPNIASIIYTICNVCHSLLTLFACYDTMLLSDAMNHNAINYLGLVTLTRERKKRKHERNSIASLSFVFLVNVPLMRPVFVAKTGCWLYSNDWEINRVVVI